MRCPCAYPHVGNLACDVPEESSSYSVMISGLHTNPEGFKCRSWWYIDPNRSNMTSQQTKRSTHPRMMYIYINPIGFYIGMACFLLCMMTLSLSPCRSLQKDTQRLCALANGQMMKPPEPCKARSAPEHSIRSTLYPPEVLTYCSPWKSGLCKRKLSSSNHWISRGLCLNIGEYIF